MPGTTQVPKARILIMLLTIVGLLAASAVMVAADHSQNRDGLEPHCPDHQTEPKDENPQAGDVNSLEVDGETIWLHYSDDLHSVEFFADEEGTQPITVKFCIKAGDKAGGEETGQEGHVSWETRGGQTPEISYVVVYRIEDDPDEPDEVTIDPETSLDNEPGTDHSVRARVTSDNEPVEDAGVRFEVWRDGQQVESGTGTTDSDGWTEDFTYTGPDEDAEDRIIACTNEDASLPENCTDEDGNILDDVVAGEGTKTWTADPEEPDEVTIDPETSLDNEPGTDHSVRARVTSDNEPVEDAGVRFEVWRDGEQVASGSDTTGEDGWTDDFTYTGPDEDAEDRIIACTNQDASLPDSCTDDDGNVLDDVVAGEGTKTWTTVVEPVGFWTCEARVIEALGLQLFEANVDEDDVECTDDEEELLSLLLGGEDGDPGAILLELARAETHNGDDPSSRAIVTGAAIRDGDGDIVVAAYVLESEAWGECDNDQPTLDSQSSVARAHLLDDDPLLDLDEETSIDALDDLVGTIHLNNTETEEDNDEARQTQRAFWWEGFPLGDIVLAEATADHHGNPCGS